MKSVFLLVLMLPYRLMIELGTPFKWEPASDIAKWSEAQLKEAYTNQWRDHYLPRIVISGFVAVIMLLLITAIIKAPIVLLCAIGAILGTLLTIDVIMVVSRQLFIINKEKEADKEDGALIVLDDLKDTTYESLARKREKGRQEFASNHGFEPSKH